jgi:hypothetical protein
MNVINVLLFQSDERQTNNNPKNKWYGIVRLNKINKVRLRSVFDTSATAARQNVFNALCLTDYINGVSLKYKSTAEFTS